MPLIHGKSDQSRSKNIQELIESGYDPSQAAAIAYSTQRKAKDSESSRTTDINEFIEIKDNPISKVGVFPYLGSQISPDLEPDKIYQVYRPEEELNNPEAIDSFKLIPWTDEHAMLGSPESGLTPAEQKGVHGVIGENVHFEDGYLKANLKVFSNKLAELIDAGKKELSIGYRCLYEVASGVFKGQKYDAIQRQIRGNHLALVDEGRSGRDVAVLDHFKFTFDAKGIVMPDINKIEEGEGKDEEISLESLAAMVKALAEKVDAMGVKDEENPELSKKSAEEGDEEIEIFKKDDDWNEEEDEADPAMFVTKARLNEDADEDGDTKKEDGDQEKPKDKGMDSNIRSILRQISQRDILAKKLSQHIGTFDHADKTLSEVAQYGVKKLGLNCKRGHEQSVLAGYLAGAKPSSVSHAQDSRAAASSCIDNYLSGGK